MGVAFRGEDERGRGAGLVAAGAAAAGAAAADDLAGRFRGTAVGWGGGIGAVFATGAGRAVSGLAEERLAWVGLVIGAGEGGGSGTLDAGWAGAGLEAGADLVARFGGAAGVGAGAFGGAAGVGTAGGLAAALMTGCLRSEEGILEGVFGRGERGGVGAGAAAGGVGFDAVGLGGRGREAWVSVPDCAGVGGA